MTPLRDIPRKIGASLRSNPYRGAEAEPIVQLRDYQVRTRNQMIQSVLDGCHPVGAVATGGGKSLIIGSLAAMGKGRVLIPTHRKELLAQNEAELLSLHPGTDVGIYSAGLGRRDLDSRIVMGGIQSIYNKMSELQRAGRFTAIIVDEADLCVPPSKPSMYRTMFEACPGAYRLGFTATPYRMDNGLLTEGDDRWFTAMPAYVGIRELTSLGYLSPLVGVETIAKPKLEGIPTQGGDYATKALSRASSEREVVQDAISEIMSLAKDRESWLVFCVDVAHTELVTKELVQRGIDARLVVGATKNREDIFEAFKNREFRALINCEVATVGSNLPCVDALCMMRPTQSRRLWEQMLGRGTRLYPGKANCVVLDLAGNIERHAPIEGLGDVVASPRLEGKRKRHQMAARLKREREVKHGAEASRSDPMEGARGMRAAVQWMSYGTAPSKSQPGKINMLANYRVVHEDHPPMSVTQWLCVEYSGWARVQVEKWFARRGVHDPPRLAHLALALAKELPKPQYIEIVRKKGFWNVRKEVFDDDPGQGSHQKHGAAVLRGAPS